MLFAYGQAVPVTLPRYFHDHSSDWGENVLISTGNFGSTEGFAQMRGDFAKEVEGKPSVLVNSFGRARNYTANDHLVHLNLAAHNLRKHNAGPSWAVVPFGPYARQDQMRDNGDSVACDAVAHWLSDYFVGITTIEAHSEKALDLMRGQFGEDRVFNLSPTPLYVEHAKKFNLIDPVVLSPDSGANARADDLAGALGAERYFIDKARREIVNVSIEGARGDVKGRDVLVVDDMADSFGTAAQGIAHVHDMGANSIRGYFGHAVNTAPAWDRIGNVLSSGLLKNIAFLNTLPRTEELESFELQYGFEVASRVSVLEVDKLLFDHIRDDVRHHPAMQPGGMG